MTRRVLGARKSRKSVEILKNSSVEFEIIEYLKYPPSIEDLRVICKKLKCKPKDIIRKSEKVYKENNINRILDQEDRLLKAMQIYPKLIERPIIVIKNKATIGRPPDNILDIL